MSDLESPQLYLITPPVFDPVEFAPKLARILDETAPICVRLALSTTDEGEISKAADLCRSECHARDTAIVIESHVLMAQDLGLDGVHLSQPNAQVHTLRKDLGEDFIIGSFAGTSKHNGINAAEAGADYVSFGPAGGSNLGDGAQADADLFAWWVEMIETPVVAEGGLTPELIKSLSDKVDFFAIGAEIWGHDDPLAQLQSLMADLRGKPCAHLPF